MGSFRVPRRLRGRASQTSRTGALSPPGPACRHTRLHEPRTSTLQLVSSVTLGGSLGHRPHVRHAVCAGFLWRLGAHGMLPRSEAGDTRQIQPRDSTLAEGGEPAVQLRATGLQARSYKPYRPPAPSTRDPCGYRAGHDTGEERRAWAGGRRAAGREKTCLLGTSLPPWAERSGCSQAPALGHHKQGAPGAGPQGPRPHPPRTPFPEAPPHTLRFPEATPSHQPVPEALPPRPPFPPAPPPRAPPGPGTRPPVATAPHKQAGCGAATQGPLGSRGPQNTLACARRCPALGTGRWSPGAVLGAGPPGPEWPQAGCELGLTGSRTQDGPRERRHQAGTRGGPFSRHPLWTVLPAPGSLQGVYLPLATRRRAAPDTQVSLQAAQWLR